MKHLHPRKGSPNLYVRMPVPRALQKRLGKREIWKSTKTSDPRAAENVAMKIITEQRERFERELAEQDSIIPVDPNEKVVERYYQKFLKEMLDQKRKHISSEDSYNEWCEKVRRWRKNYVTKANTGDYGRLREIAIRFVRDENVSIALDGAEFEDLLERMMVTIIDALDTIIKQIEGEFDAAPKSTFVRETLAAQENKAAPGERLKDYLEKYASEEMNEKGRKPGNVAQMKSSVLLFTEFVGDDRNVRTLTKGDASGFREVLSSFPTGRGKSKKLSGMSISECIKLAEQNDLDRLSARTCNRYISDLSGFFSWLTKRGHCDENIWTGMSFHVGKDARSLHTFTTEELNTILKSPLYSGFLASGKEHLPGNQHADDWRFWIPLICMFTGARVTEVAQLHVDDLEEKEGYLIGYVKADPKRGQSTKTDRSERLVVFHSKLLRAGLKEYWLLQCKRAKEDGNEQMFPELTAYEKRSELGRKPARWWIGYLKKIGLTEGGKGYGSHSFRHRLADEMREAGYMDSEFGHLVMGHSDRSMTSRYGRLPQGTVQRLAAMIEKAEFRGVDFSRIFPTKGDDTSAKILTSADRESTDD